MDVYFISLGCDKNLVDSEVMLGILKEDGHHLVFDEAEADVIVVNTCSFIEDATNESLQHILRLAEYKEDRCKALIVTGCMVQRYRKEIFNELPEVDAIIGTGDYEAIGRVLRELNNGAKQIELVTCGFVDEQSYLNRVPATGHFAYLKIAEGCDNDCTYCTIPSIRGGYRSRNMESLIDEARMLAEKGVKELVIVAQDTALYGKELYGSPQLHTLIGKLSAIDGISWIRIMYCYPEHITDELIHEMSVNPKVCHYLDMPVQHGCNTVLKRMGRRGSAEDVRTVVAKLRAAMPGIALRTSIIAGFPGETEEEFEELLRFVEDIRFDRLGVFAYSKEDGTPAARMKDQLTKAVKERRRKQIMRLQQGISAEKCSTLTGRILEIIVDGRLPEDDVYCGRSYRDCYDVDGMVFFKSEYELMTGDFVKVEITGSSEHDLTGRLHLE